MVNPAPGPLPLVSVWLRVGPALFELLGLGEAAAPDVPGGWERRFELPPEMVGEVLTRADGRHPAATILAVHSNGSAVCDLSGRAVVSELARLHRGLRHAPLCPPALRPRRVPAGV